jgi:hypothetical protein
VVEPTRNVRQAVRLAKLVEGREEVDHFESGAWREELDLGLRNVQLDRQK